MKANEQQIELRTMRGDLVLVLDPYDDILIYMMRMPPEVLVWGDRVFTHNSALSFTKGRMVYTEGIAVPVLTGMWKHEEVKIGEPNVPGSDAGIG